MASETYAGLFSILALHTRDVSRAMEAVARAGGLVVPGAGDPLLALFGEDGADAAVGCFESLSDLEPRAAIATGVLEITGSADSAPVIVGDALDRVRALVSMARPGQLLLDEETRGRIRKYLVEPLPSVPVKGRSEPVRVYEMRPMFSSLNKVYGNMLDAMAGGSTATVGETTGGEESNLEALWNRSVEEGRWAGRVSSDVADPAADAVDCTVFAPPEVASGGSFLVQVFAHLFESAEQVAELALEMDPAARRRGFKSLEVPVARGESLSFELSMPGLDIDDPVQTMVWNGRPQSVQFGVTVPGQAPSGAVIGTVTVSRRTIPIGHLKFKLTVARDAPAATEPEPCSEAAQRYSLAFVSYSSADRKKVLERVQMLGAVGIRYFQDVLDLDPGERWERKLYQRIDECDLFLLFWSSAAKESEWVRKEVDYALARKGGDDLAPPEIRPVILEGPPIVPPPSNLAHLHFNDRMIYFMVGA